MFGGYVKVRESLYTQVVIGVNTILKNLVILECYHLGTHTRQTPLHLEGGLIWWYECYN